MSYKILALFVLNGELIAVKLGEIYTKIELIFRQGPIFKQEFTYSSVSF